MSDEIRPLPLIPREVYAAARDASKPSQEVDDRIACATEAVWSMAWRAAYAERDASRERARVKALRWAADHAAADVASGRDVGAEGEAGSHG